MKITHLNPYFRATLVLMVTAVLLIVVAIVTDRRDLTSASLVISSLVCLLTGIFLLTLSGSDPLDLRYVSLLSVQDHINLCRICAELGFSGNACFIPAGSNGITKTMQYLPVSVYDGGPIPQNTLVTGPDNAGLLMVPSGDSLLKELRQHENLVTPSDISSLKDLIKEVAIEVLEVAEKITVTDTEDTITLQIEGYRLIAGCHALLQESPRCCALNPCPVCSIFACLIAEGTGRIIEMEHCSAIPKKDSVTAVFTFLALPDRNP